MNATVIDAPLLSYNGQILQDLLNFFETPPDKIQWFSDAARECVY